MKKPTVLVDQDGPLADFDGLLFGVCSTLGITVDCLPHEQRHRYSTDHIVDADDRAIVRGLIDNSRWFRHLLPTEGAIEGMNRLAEVADVWVCSKPLECNPHCRDDKAAWLGHHFGQEWVSRLILSPDKSMVRGHILLDDAIDLGQIKRATWQPVIFSTSWNGEGSQWAPFPRWSWEDDVQQLLELQSKPSDRDLRRVDL